MYVYRLKTALAAIAQDPERRMKIVTLDTGTMLRTRGPGPILPHTGLVEVMVGEQILSVFVQDLETRAERVDESGA